MFTGLFKTGVVKNVGVVPNSDGGGLHDNGAPVGSYNFRS